MVNPIANAITILYIVKVGGVVKEKISLQGVSFFSGDIESLFQETNSRKLLELGGLALLDK